MEQNNEPSAISQTPKGDCTMHYTREFENAIDRWNADHEEQIELEEIFLSFGRVRVAYGIVKFLDNYGYCGSIQVHWDCDGKCYYDLDGEGNSNSKDKPYTKGDLDLTL